MFVTTLLLAVVAQSASTMQGAAIGPNKEPVGQVLIFISHGPAEDGSIPALGQGVTDAQGRYRLEARKGRPSSQVGQRLVPTILGYRPGMALHGRTLEQPGSARDPSALQVVLEAAVNRTIQVNDKSGKPLVGVRLAPVMFSSTSTRGFPVYVPDALADRLAVTTGPDGRAVLSCLGASTTLHTIRVSGPAVATQVIDYSRAPLSSPAVVVLDPTGRLTGRVMTEDGKPAAGVEVQVWSMASGRFGPSRVRFDGEPIRAGDDGSFRTPPGLLVGSLYNLVVAAEGWEQLPGRPIKPSAGDVAEIRAGDVLLRPLLALSGRVVDTQGRAVADAEVAGAQFREAVTVRTRSLSQGQFRLTGLHKGRSIVLATRAAGFWATGQVVNDGQQGAIRVVLTRLSEPCPHVMKTLPGPIPDDEAHKLARQVFDPYLEIALDKGTPQDKLSALQSLAGFDPLDALALLSDARLASQPADDIGMLRWLIVQQVAPRDFAKAKEVADGTDHLYYRARALVELSRHPAAGDRAARLKLLDQAEAAAHGEPRFDVHLVALADVAARYADLGENANAKALAAEVIDALDKRPQQQGSSLSQTLSHLARVDLPAARALVEQQPTAASRRPGVYADSFRQRVYGNAATLLAASEPAEAERLLEAASTIPTRFTLSCRVCYRMAPADLPRARRIALSQADTRFQVYALVCAAAGLHNANRPSAREVVREALDLLDRAGDGDEGNDISLATLLPRLEAIDPALVSELFWRLVARQNGRGGDLTPLARYDRAVPNELHPSARAAKNPPGGKRRPYPLQLTDGYIKDLVLFDPLGALEDINAKGEPTGPTANANMARVAFAEMLGRKLEARWAFYSSRMFGGQDLLLGTDDFP